MPTCPVCNRKYQRKSCEYCERDARWDPNSIKSMFSLRIQKDLESIDLDTQAAEDFEYIIESKMGKGLYIEGDVGSGKTLYAAALMKYSLYHTYIHNDFRQHAFVSVPKLFFQLKETMDPTVKITESDILKPYMKVDWLVLDDIGIEKVSEWSLQSLYILIDERYNNLKTTIFTSNLTLDDLADKWNDDRIPSRIFSMCLMDRVKKLDKKDWRMNAD